MIATKALACKLAKAAWYLMAEETTLRSGTGCLGKRPKRNENLNLGARPSARKGVGFKPLGLIGEGRTLPGSGTVRGKALPERFDRAVNQKRVGSACGAW